ncbi:endocuticle structural glycoprotein SgAbd-1-like [Cydia amplana]|uniref:endocuticle structural glycoprotein SgAbd-1-like n=1 Tax=Cydia amplana TaxID=1869771 RepID=UPI002FE67C39
MYSKLVFVCLAMASVRAAPAATDVVPLEKQQPTVIPIVSQSEELENNGTYKFSYETGNGIKREETSYDKVLPKVQGRSAAGDSNEGGESEESNEVHVQQGSYSYTAPDGTVISVRYVLPRVQGRSAAGDSNEGGESDESNEVHVQQGSYSYTAPDGTVISVR